MVAGCVWLRWVGKETTTGGGGGGRLYRRKEGLRDEAGGVEKREGEEKDGRERVSRGGEFFCFGF